MTTREAWLVPSVAAAVLPLLPLRLAQSASTMDRICARHSEASAVFPVIACTKAAPCNDAFVPFAREGGGRKRFSGWLVGGGRYK